MGKLRPESRQRYAEISKEEAIKNSEYWMEISQKKGYMRWGSYPKCIRMYYLLLSMAKKACVPEDNRFIGLANQAYYEASQSDDWKFISDKMLDASYYMAKSMNLEEIANRITEIE